MKLTDILITDELKARERDPRSKEAEHAVLNGVASSMHLEHAQFLSAVAQTALDLCNADSAGVSVLMDVPEQGFTWDALVGRFGPFLNGTAPRHGSPCGVSIDSGEPQLFSHPERLFEWMRGPGIPIVEGLVIPIFSYPGIPYGSLWIMLHEPGRKFTRSHLDIMELLGGHISAAVQLHVQRQQEITHRAGL